MATAGHASAAAMTMSGGPGADDDGRVVHAEDLGRDDRAVAMGAAGQRIDDGDEGHAALRSCSRVVSSQTLAQGRQVAGAADEQPSDEPAAAVEEGARVAGEWVALDLHAVVAGSGAGELQAHAVLVAPEGRRRRRRAADAEDGRRDGGALASGRLPVACSAHVAGRVDVRQAGATLGVGGDRTGGEPAAVQPAGGRGHADGHEHGVAGDAAPVAEPERADARATVHGRRPRRP